MDFPLVIFLNSLPANPISFNHKTYDVILRMDWLKRCFVEILCKDKIVRIKTPKGSQDIPLIKYKRKISIISKTKALERLKKRWTTIPVSHIGEMKVNYFRVKPLVCEFPNIFPEELPILSPPRIINFHIHLISDVHLFQKPFIGLPQWKWRNYKNNWMNFWKRDS